MSTVLNKKQEIILTRAQYEARKTAGTLEVGAIYNITNDLTDYTIPVASWTALSGQSPYTVKADITLIATPGAQEIVELINDQATLFATYGFAIGSITNNIATIYAIDIPTTAVTLSIKIGG